MTKSDGPDQDLNLQALYSVKDVQQILKIGRTQAYALISSRAIPSIHIKRSLRVTKKDMDAFIAENRHDR